MPVRWLICRIASPCFRNFFGCIWLAPICLVIEILRSRIAFGVGDKRTVPLSPVHYLDLAQLVAVVHVEVVLGVTGSCGAQTVGVSSFLCRAGACSRRGKMRSCRWGFGGSKPPPYRGSSMPGLQTGGTGERSNRSPFLIGQDTEPSPVLLPIARGQTPPRRADLLYTISTQNRPLCSF